MKKKMMLRGIGLEFTGLSILYSLLVLALHQFFFPEMALPLGDEVRLAFGALLILTGLLTFVMSARQIHKAFREGRLETKGLYSLCRHPVYSSWLLLIVPGVVLLFNSMLGLTVPIFMYLILKKMVVEEEMYLEGKFGRRYLDYKRQTSFVIPRFRL